MADSRRRPLSAQASRPRRTAFRVGHAHVHVRPVDARLDVPAADRRSADDADQHRRLHRRRLQWGAVPADGGIRVLDYGHAGSRTRLRHEVPGDRGIAERAGDGGCVRDRFGEERLMPKMNLSHFEASFLFAVFTSVVLGVVTKRTDRDRLHYGIYTFVCFLVALFGIGWIMYLGHG